MKTGDKVICVDAQPCWICGLPMGLTEGGIYVVEKHGTHENGLAVVWLVGQRTACSFRHKEPQNSFGALRFRKLEELKAENVERESKVVDDENAIR